MIIARSPHRISLAGGGTDIPDFYRKHEFGAVCSFSINKYVYVTLNNLADYFPHRFRIAYSQTELTQETHSIKHPIIREALKAMNLEGGIDVNIMSDIPAGTGMGSSSTFTVTFLHALNAFKNRLSSKEGLANEACRLEIDILKEHGGKQDQYAAAFGGINLIQFNADESVNVRPLPISEENRENLLNHLMLFYLGGNRSGSPILRDQSNNSHQNTDALIQMRDQAIEVAEILTSKPPYDRIGDVLFRGWELKRNLAKSISNHEIDQYMEKALKAGAMGGKLLGAGGTGFLLFYVKPEKQNTVRQALSELREIHYQYDPMGSMLLYYGN